MRRPDKATIAGHKNVQQQCTHGCLDEESGPADWISYHCDRKSSQPARFSSPLHDEPAEVLACSREMR